VDVLSVVRAGACVVCGHGCVCDKHHIPFDLVYLLPPLQVSPGSCPSSQRSQGTSDLSWDYCGTPTASGCECLNGWVDANGERGGAGALQQGAMVTHVWTCSIS
jgi:hypothetical protein